MRHLLASAVIEAKKHGYTEALFNLICEARCRISTTHEAYVFHKVMSQIQIYIGVKKANQDGAELKLKPHAIKKGETWHHE